MPPRTRIHTAKFFLVVSLTCALLLNGFVPNSRCAHSVVRADEVFGLDFAHVTVDNSGPDWSGSQGMHIKTIGDLNGDGRTDLIVAGSLLGEPIVWYESPTWAKHTVTDSTLGGWSTDAEVGDIDNDGDQDIVISSWYREDKGIEWFENTGNGLSWTRHIIGSPRAHDMELADFDRDGDLDIVTRQQESEGNKLELWEQNSPTSWSHRTLTTSVPTGEGLMIGDIDNDSDPDIIIAGIWFENTRDIMTGTWPAHTYTTAWTEPDANAETADINRDGLLDIILTPSEKAAQQYRIAWYQAPADPTATDWTEHIVDNTTECVLHSLRVADIDKDGDLDLITAEMHQSSNPDEVRVYINEGTGGLGTSWHKEVIATSGSHFMRIGDFDRDGDIDLFGANWTGTRIVDLWRNDLNSKLTLDTWTRHVIDAERPWKSVFISFGDMDRDGKNDILTGGWWYRNPGDPAGTWVRNDIGSPLNNMAAVYDYDQDGDLDVLGTPWAGSGADANFHWARNDGTGIFTILSNITIGEGDFLQGVAVGRFQPKGNIETALSWHAGTGNGIQMLTTPTDPSTDTWPWARISDTDQQEQLSVGDIDRDGDLDLLLGTQWLRNDNTSYSIHTLFNTTDQPDRNRLADINNDGRLDAVVGYLGISTTAKLAWYEQPLDPTQAWTEHLIANIVGPMSLDTADVDRDGDLDVVAGEHNLSNPSSAGLFVFENSNGTGTTWQQHTVYIGDEHHDGAQLVDIDKDGDLDIISIGWSHNNVLLYENRNTSNVVNPNQPPTVDAGQNQYIKLPVAASLTGIVTDDGLPDPPAALTITWSKTSGPGTVTFANPSATNTTANFSTDGTYVLQLQADDGEFVVSGEVTIYVFTAGDRVIDGLTVLYTFQEGTGTTVNDISGVGTPMNLTIAEPSEVTWSPDVLSVHSPTIIRTDSAATKLYDAIAATNEITVEAWIKPANVTQDGPARVITMSADPSNRNFTLGQGLWGTNPADVVNARLRTTDTNNDGEPSITTSAGTISTELAHVVYTRNTAGIAQVYTDNIVRATGTIAGSFATWNSDYPFALANEMTVDRPWVGTFHMVAIYQRALNPSEVEQNFTVGPPSSPRLPIIATLDDDSTAPGTPYLRTPTLTQGTPPITWSLTTGPTEMTINPDTGQVTWADPQPRDSSYLVSINAANAAGSDTATWTLYVRELPPIIAPLSDDDASSGTPYSRTPTLTQGTAPVTWSLITGPAGMTIDPQTGQVAWSDPQPPGSSYIVTILAANTVGTDDETWTLRVPAIGSFFSDDFNTCSLDTDLWQIVNPLGDATFEVNGIATNDATLTISLPENTSHNIWSDANNTARLLQSADDSDFEIEVKFDAPLTGESNIQGILIEQDQEHFLRFDFYRSDDEYRIFSAIIWGSSASIKLNSSIAVATPLSMRITRQGDLWTLSYSYEGQTWNPAVAFTHPMNVSAIGPFAGNLGPGLNAVIDYFFNTAAPIEPEDGLPPSNPGTTITTSTEGNGSITWEPDADIYYCDEVVTLTAIPDIGWSFTGWSQDATGTENPVEIEMNSHKTITAHFVQDIEVPPVIEVITDHTTPPGVSYDRAPILTQGEPPITWSLITGPLGMTINTVTGELSWLNPQPPSSAHPVTIEATNSAGSYKASWTLTVAAIPPTIATIADSVIDPATAYTCSPTLTQGTLPITWTLIDAPSEMTLNTTTGKVTWTNPQPPGSVHGITIEATNATGTDQESWTLTVNPFPPIITTIVDASLAPGVPYHQSPILTQGTPPITWSLLTAPVGMNIDPETGELSWPDPQPPTSDHSITIEARNAAGTDEENWTLTVAAWPPIITAITDELITPSMPYSRNPTLTQGTTPIEWTLAAGPSDMTIDPQTGEVSWADPQPPGSLIAISVKAANSAGTDVATWTITIGQRITQGLIALYTFQEGDGVTVTDVSNVGTPMDLTIVDPANVTWEIDGLSVNIPTLIGSDGPATKLFDAITTSNEITIEAWLTPANITQDGPARVITMSADTSNRNFTLGQGLWGSNPADVINVRLRTTNTNLDGEPSLTTSAGAIAVDRTHVVYTHATIGTAQTYTNNTERASTTIEGDFSNWDSSYTFALANEFTSPRPWLGTFHLVAVYDRAFSPTEVNQNFLMGPPSSEFPPAISPLSDDATAPGTPYARTPTLAEGTPPVTWALLAGPTGMTVNTDTGEINWLNPQPPASSQTITIEAANELGSFEASWTLAIDARPPVIAAVPDHTIQPDDSYQRALSLTQGTLPVSWSLITGPTGMTLSPSTGQISWTDPQPPESTHWVTVRATNIAGNDETSWTLTIDALPPVVATLTNASTAPNTPYTQTPTLTQGTPPITWSLLTGPAGITIDPNTGEVTWPNPQPPATSHTITIEASNTVGNDAISWTLSIDRIPPSIATLTDDTVDPGMVYTRTPTLAQGTLPVTWLLVAGPSDLTVNPTTGQVHWLAPQPPGTSRPVTIEARNGAGSDQATWTLTVNRLPPVIVALSDDATDPAVPYSRTPTLTQGTPPITWSITTGPSGMTIDSGTGKVSWPDPQPPASSHAVVIEATNSAGTRNTTWTLTVNALPPVIANLPNDATDPAIPYTRSPTLIQGTPPVAWSLVSGPSGMTIGPETGNLSWPNPQPPDSSHTISIEANNAAGSDETTWTLTVNPLPPIIATLPDDETDPYVPYMKSPTLTQGTPPITWSLIASPTGMTIEPGTGDVTWSSPQPPGTSRTVTIEARNSAGADETNWTLTVHRIPPIMAQLDDDSIDPGVPYNRTPTLTQGTPPLTWSLITGPAGATIDVLTGQVTWPHPEPPESTNPITVQASNSAGNDTATWTLTVLTWTGYPADINFDWHITIEEVTAYAGCWRSGCTWVFSPNPVPIAYVSRAGYLWRIGEAYLHDPNELCNTEVAYCYQPIDPNGSNNAKTIRASLDSPNRPTVYDQRPSKPAYQDIDATLLKTADSIKDVTAHRSITSNVSHGNNYVIHIEITPPANTLAWALEELPPFGCSVVNINEAGTLDAPNHKVKWGPFFDSQSRTLRYTVAFPETQTTEITLSGVVSVDGQKKAIDGDNLIPHINPTSKQTTTETQIPPNNTSNSQETPAADESELPFPLALFCGAGLGQTILCTLAGTLLLRHRARKFCAK